MARLESFPDHFTLDRYAHEMRRRELDRLWRRAALALTGLAHRSSAGTSPHASRRTLHPQ